MGRGKGTKSQTKSSKAGLQFPVGRMLRYLKKGRYGKRTGVGAGVYIAAACEYLAAEILELSGNSARANKRIRITPKDIGLAVWHDEELDRLFQNKTIPSTGRPVNIHVALRPPNTTNAGLPIREEV